MSWIPNTGCAAMYGVTLMLIRSCLYGMTWKFSCFRDTYFLQEGIIVSSSGSGLMCTVADIVVISFADPGSGAFLTPGSGIGTESILWCKSGIRDVKTRIRDKYPGSATRVVMPIGIRCIIYGKTCFYGPKFGAGSSNWYRQYRTCVW